LNKEVGLKKYRLLKKKFLHIDGILLKGRIPQKSKNEFLVSKFSEKIGA
jgi:hypothetical protein